MSEMSTLQRTVASFAWTGASIPDHAKLLDLVSEAGEMGDVLFALVCLAHDTGVDLEVTLNKALDKYNQRLALEGDAAASEG
jgi:NTP pyrophosphatase (non-canonical NTP hydrolase)